MDPSEIIALIIVVLAFVFAVRFYFKKKNKGSCCKKGCHPPPSEK